MRYNVSFKEALSTCNVARIDGLRLLAFAPADHPEKQGKTLLICDVGKTDAVKVDQDAAVSIDHNTGIGSFNDESGNLRHIAMQIVQKPRSVTPEDFGIRGYSLPLGKIHNLSTKTYLRGSYEDDEKEVVLRAVENIGGGEFIIFALGDESVGPFSTSAEICLRVPEFVANWVFARDGTPYALRFEFPDTVNFHD